jgi:nucleoid-associated protein YgaU
VRAGAYGSAPAAPPGGSGTVESSSVAPSKTPARSSSHTDRSASRGDYTVREGDTLSGIAARHGTTWQRLYAANKAAIGGDPDVIVPGLRLTF